uniref:Uncharacterized protein n=1 Tax=Morganella morganii TaxID=582 RepID=A0A6B7PVD4_MORMO|nr:hypothetical protein [Morganella morganii]
MSVTHSVFFKTKIPSDIFTGAVRQLQLVTLVMSPPVPK